MAVFQFLLHNRNGGQQKTFCFVSASFRHHGCNLPDEGFRGETLGVVGGEAALLVAEDEVQRTNGSDGPVGQQGSHCCFD